MVDVTVVREFMLEVIPAVATVGVAVLGIKWLVQALKLMREQVGYTDDQYHAHRSANEASAEQSDPWSGYAALDDARDLAAAGLGVNENWAESAEIQSGSSGLTPVYRPATAEEAASWAEINAKFDAQEAADAAFFGAMTPYEKYLAKATPEDLARDAELKAEIAAEDERIAAKYGVPVPSEAENTRRIVEKEDRKANEFEAVMQGDYLDKSTWTAAMWQAHAYGASGELHPSVDRGSWTGAQWAAFERGQAER